MAEVALYIETDGTSASPEAAVADAAAKSPDVPFEEGSLVEVKIEATWTDPDGNHHARVSVIKVEEPHYHNDEELIPLETSGASQTDDKDNVDDAALENAPELEEAKDDFEDDFDGAAEKYLEEEPKEEPFPKKGYHSEGLRPVQPEPDRPAEN